MRKRKEIRNTGKKKVGKEGKWRERIQYWLRKMINKRIGNKSNEERRD